MNNLIFEYIYYPIKLNYRSNYYKTIIYMKTMIFKNINEFKTK
jgi:hypothetical protein